MIAAHDDPHSLFQENWEERVGLLGAVLDRAPDSGDLTGRRIGPWHLIRELGRGGMGVVYLAERVDGQFEQQVALKLLRQGVLPDHVERFRAERQILASLRHPGIARLLDGGVTEDGTPYLALTYIDGEPITTYCDTRQLSIDERLALFRQVCRAVQYAHRNLVVHRDLKPSNILVTEGDEGPQVKLLDFGIAKLLDTNNPFTAVVTRSGFRLMTPEYASPEQIRGEPITVATDVYQLGVVLYELLTGHRPYRLEQRQYHAVARAILEEEPTRPSTVVQQTEQLVEPEATPESVSRARNVPVDRLQRRLAGDLDVICLKALRKEPDRRYESAGALAEDVRRHLEGLPVAARPDTTGYRMRKFVRRHRLGVTLTAGFVLLLIGFAVAMGVQQAATARERDRAERELAKAEEVTRFLTGLFKANRPEEARGDTLTAADLLERGAARVEEMNEQPGVQIRLLQVLGGVYFEQGKMEQAESFLRRAVDLQEAEPEAAFPVARAEVMNTLASVLDRQGQHAEADSLYQHVLDLRPELPDSLVATYLHNYSINHRRRQGYEEAESYAREAVALRTAVFGPEDGRVGLYKNNLAAILFRQGRQEEAEQMFRDVLALYQRVLGNDHPYTASALNNLGVVLKAQGKLEEAEQLQREGLALDRRLLGDRHPQLSFPLTNLGNLRVELGRPDEALPLFEEALSILEEAFPEGHWQIAWVETRLATALIALERYSEAEPLLLRSHSQLEADRGPSAPETQAAFQSLHELYTAWDKPDEAARYAPPDSTR